jgi:hypothetical protein
MAEGCCDAVQRELSMTRVVVPWKMPVCAPVSQKEYEVKVKHVVCGSEPARKIAKECLEDILDAILVRGNPLSLSEVRGPADVADSESLWEAVQLWRHLQQHDGGETGGTPRAWM